MKHNYMRNNNHQNCFGSHSLYFNACNCFSWKRSISLFLCRNSIYPILYLIFYNSSRGLSADHYFGTFLYL